jgi:hypothetical protein
VFLTSAGFGGCVVVFDDVFDEVSDPYDSRCHTVSILFPSLSDSDFPISSSPESDN